jgi:hypothetical protein
MKTQKQLKRLRENQIFIMVLIIAVFAVLFIQTVNAQTIQVASPDLAIRDVIVYYPNYTLYGLYNTSSLITLDANYSYVFTLKPQQNSFIDDPTNWLTNTAFPWVRTNAVALLLISIFIGYIFGRRS